MTLAKDHISGLIFLVVSVTYGYYAQQIPLLPGDEFEPFNAQTLPLALATLGVLLSIILIATAKRPSEADDTAEKVRYQFSLVAKLLALTSLYALALNGLGFVLASILFLATGYWLLGVRSVKLLAVASIPFVLVFWLVLTQLLDIYLAPGQWLAWLGAN